MLIALTHTLQFTDREPESESIMASGAAVAVRGGVSGLGGPELCNLHMECEDEELSEAQVAFFAKRKGVSPI